MKASDDRAFLGHPKALGFLAFTEAWERFSFYGMQSLLVLYMVKQLLLPGHVEHVAGFGLLRGAFESFRGPLSAQALASAIFGLYAGLVYLTPIFGGFIADRLLGRTATITLGAILMAMGHFLMAFDVSFLPALACLIVGCGCFKGNLASQIGGLYAPGDLRRADAFQIYYLAINAGVILAPLVAGTLGEKVAWHYGFGVAGVGMLVALTVYLSARRLLPADPPLRARDPAARPRLKPGEGGTIAILLILLPVLTISVIGNQQIFNALLVWCDSSVDLQVAGYQMPTSWIITFDSVVSVSALAGVAAFWRVWAKSHKEPDEVGKIAIGCAVAACGMLCLVAGAAVSAATGQKASVLWVLAFMVFNEIGFANVFPVSLALYARAAPAAVTSTMIGVFYLHLFAANNLVGWIGGFLGKIPATQFWLIHAATSAFGCVAFVVAGRLFGDRLSPKGDAPLPELSSQPEGVAAS